MKEKNESWLLSPHAAYHLELSIDFLHTRPVMDIGANEIPAELLQTWIAPGPKELLIRMADGSAGPNETMPYEVFARAHERHDRSYAEMLEREFHTPAATVNRNFLLYQEILRIVARLREKRIEVPPPCSTSSITRSPYRPPGSMRGNTAFRPYEMIRRTRTKE